MSTVYKTPLDYLKAQDVFIVKYDATKSKKSKEKIKNYIAPSMSNYFPFGICSSSTSTTTDVLQVDEVKRTKLDIHRGNMNYNYFFIYLSISNYFI